MASKLTIEDVDLFLKHKNILRLTEYKNTKTKMNVMCLGCNNEWKTTLGSLKITKNGCRICSKRVLLSNGGEFKIPNTNFWADGYCNYTNTVYEFYGDSFHGNLDVYEKHDCCHPYDDSVTAELLFNKTKKREKIIKDNGFSVISIWESEYDKGVMV